MNDEGRKIVYQEKQNTSNWLYGKNCNKYKFGKEWSRVEKRKEQQIPVNGFAVVLKNTHTSL